MEIFSRVHNKNLIINEKPILLCLHSRGSCGLPGLWEGVFGFHMGAAVRQKKKRSKITRHRRIIKERKTKIFFLHVFERCFTQSSKWFCSCIESKNIL